MNIVYMCVCVNAFVNFCARVRACLRACVRARSCVRVCARYRLTSISTSSSTHSSCFKHVNLDSAGASSVASSFVRLHRLRLLRHKHNYLFNVEQSRVSKG